MGKPFNACEIANMIPVFRPNSRGLGVSYGQFDACVDMFVCMYAFRLSNSRYNGTTSKHT